MAELWRSRRREKGARTKSSAGSRHDSSTWKFVLFFVPRPFSFNIVFLFLCFAGFWMCVVCLLLLLYTAVPLIPPHSSSSFDSFGLFMLLLVSCMRFFPPWLFGNFPPFFELGISTGISVDCVFWLDWLG
ncbi:hypothetical protein CC80DRAFT_53770 [Byssothecium circinans]|uniref:Transmembrane protein n=1 Tax=Byssothecium circinans TaxID=147558 RepID=A0A6A5TX92_9PLEO|nr:hypothetical protein CC80DRAFT_53770 [Byssothecium circinans]